MAKHFYEKVLAVDFDSFLNASRHERTSRRRGYRNGHRSRSLLTTVGALDIRVPRDREGQYRPDLFDRYKRVDRSLEEAIKAMFLGGVSTRKVSDILHVLCGERLSASKVSTVVKGLDQAVRDFTSFVDSGHTKRLGTGTYSAQLPFVNNIILFKRLSSK